MCSIDKMLIKGIRSFSPQNQIAIEFHKPLTLIVGQNGAGKTTIIECLKMSCTGELPPNVKNGQNFVRDPTMNNESEVKAQIKLRVYGPSGQPFVITRSMQVTQKKTQKQFKSLDSSLMSVNQNTGAQETMSYRCADLDKLIPGMLGVSKAILENVIFVHQEDSYWPMSEGSVLKKKFDDIFAASKYTKVVVEMKDLCKEKNQLGRELKLQVQNLKTHLENYNKLQDNISVAKEKEKSMQENISALDQNIQKSNQAIYELEDKCQKLVSFGEQLIQLQTRQEEVSSQTKSFLEALGDNGDYDDSTEDLLQWQQKFEEQMGNVRADLERIRSDIDQKKTYSQELDVKYNQFMQKQGRLQAEQDSYEHTVKDLNEFIVRISSQVGLSVNRSGIGGSLTPSEMKQFLQQLNQKVGALKTSLEQTKTSNRQMMQQANETLSKIINERGSITEKIRMKKEQLQQNENKMRNLQDEISMSSVGPQLVLDYKEQVQDAHSALERKEQEFQNLNLDQSIANESEQIGDLDRQLSRLRQERNQAVSSSEGSTRLRLKKQELLAKEQQFQNLLSSWSSRLKSTLRVEEVPSQNEIKPKLEDVLNQKQQQKQQLTQKIRQAAAIDSQLEGQLSRAQQRLQSQQQEVSRLDQQIQQGMAYALQSTSGNVSNNQNFFQQSLSEKEKKHQDSLNKVIQSNAMMKLAGTYKSSGEQHNTCPICLRGFNNTSEKKRFMDHMDQQLQQLPQQLQKVEEKKQKYETQLTRLKELNPVWLKCQDLKNIDIPATKEEIQNLQQQKQEAYSKTASLEEDMMVMEVEAKNLQNMFNDLALPADRLHKEIYTSQSQLRELEATVRVSGGTSGTRNVSEVDDDIERCDGLRRKHQENKEDLQRKQQRIRDELNHLNNRWREAKEELQSVEYKAMRQEELKKQLEQLNSDNDKFGAEIVLLERSVCPLSIQEQKMREEHDRQRQQAETKEYELDVQIRELQQVADQVENKYAVVRKFQESNLAEELQQVTNQLSQSKQLQQNLQEEINKLNEEYQTSGKKIDDKEKIKREIEDCLRYRKSKAALEEISQNIVDLEQRMAEIGDTAKFMDDIKKQKSEKEILMSQRDMLKGSVNTIKAEIKQNLNTLNQDQYKEIEGRFRRQVIEEAANEVAVQDMEMYYKALEKALLQFHKNKMADINRIILELWRKTYRGDDIDYIEIKADQETSGKASYTYRVVMHVQGTQLDMRGRCSTGQKVLACLIIRLALAETFCLNCGVLALDEPTTNLDAANSKSLAQELRHIIQSRQSQESFQLIVITHDRQFAKLISGEDQYVETMWQVTKDNQGHSLLEKVPLKQ